MVLGRRAPTALVALLVAASLVVVADVASAAGGITYVRRVATANVTTASTTVRLKTSASVAAGDTLVVTALLGGTGSATVTASDPAGDKYTIDRDQSDAAGNRLLVLSAINVKALSNGTTVTLTYPSASPVFATLDDFRGIASVSTASSAAGATGAFSSGTVPASPSQMLFGTAGVLSGQNPTWNSGWHALSTVGNSTRRLAPAYQLPTSAGSYSASGNANASWVAAVVVFSPQDSPPVARLSVSPSSGAPPLTVTADASASTDTDFTPIATYQFDFGDGTTAGPQSGATASHTYSNTGTFPVTVTVTDTAGLSSQTKATVTVSTTPTAPVNVYAGYYDTRHANTNPKPNPWMGSPNVVFQGVPDSSSGGWDTSGVRIDNVSGASLAFVSVTLDIGTHHFALWPTTSLAAGQTLIAAQTGYENFDGSDTNPAGCYGCAASTCTTEVRSTVPVVHVTVNGVTTDYPDPAQILNTRGVDAAGCPYTGTRNDESETWQQLSSGP